MLDYYERLRTFRDAVIKYREEGRHASEGLYREAKKAMEGDGRLMEENVIRVLNEELV
tara:strand:+ start:3742 stop:3915 length:174 start_codon:yes stop_codon:yes gene_type:complete